MTNASSPETPTQVAVNNSDHTTGEVEVNMTAAGIRKASQILQVLARNQNITPGHCYRGFITTQEVLGRPTFHPHTERGIFSICIRMWMTNGAEQRLQNALQREIDLHEPSDRDLSQTIHAFCTEFNPDEE